MTNFSKDLYSTNNVVQQRAVEMQTRLLNNDDEFSVDEEGVMRWNSNGRVPPSEITEFAAELMHDIDDAACAGARMSQDRKALAQYVVNRANMSDEQRREEAVERRAAFGPGETVVNVLTGEKFRT